MSIPTMAVTFGDGKYLPIAKASLLRFQEMNDMEGLVLDIMKLPNGLPHQSWVKAWIWEQVPDWVERVVWFDADVVPLRPMMDEVPEIDIAFCGVEDHPKAGRQVAQWHDKAVVDFPHYFNAGVFVAHRKTESMFNEWREGASGKQQPYWDQTPLNLLLARKFPNELFELPKICNWLNTFGPMPEAVRMAHLAGWDNSELRLDVLRIAAILSSPPARMSREERGVACLARW